MPNALDELAARIAALEEAAREQRRSSTLAYSSIDDGALTVTSAGKLRAVIGQQPDGTTGVNLVNGPVPAIPSKPTAAPTLGGVRVTWDGKFADGSPGPMDLVRVEVHAARAPGTGPSPATLITTIDTPQGGTVTVPANAPVWVALVARTTSGRASAPSATATAGPAVVVAQEVMAGIIGDLQLAAGSVTAAKVAAGAIDDRAIAEAAVTAAKIGLAAVTAGKIAQNAVTAGAVAADAITAREIVAGAITAAELAAGAVTTASLAAGSVTASQIAANSVTASKLAANAVTASSIAADAVAAGAIAAASVTGREIRAQSITTDKLAVNSVTASQIAAGAVTAAALTADAIDGRTIRGVTITGGTVTGGTVQTGASGARVVILPDISWLPNVKMPAIQLSTGLGTETQPAMLRADPLAGRLLMSSPEFSDGGWAYVDLNSATAPDEQGHIEMGVGSPGAHGSGSAATSAMSRSGCTRRRGSARLLPHRSGPRSPGGRPRTGMAACDLRQRMHSAGELANGRLPDAAGRPGGSPRNRGRAGRDGRRSDRNHRHGAAPSPGGRSVRGRHSRRRGGQDLHPAERGDRGLGRERPDRRMALFREHRVVGRLTVCRPCHRMIGGAGASPCWSMP